MKPVFAALVLMLLIGAASAGTVTLSGACSTKVINQTSNYTDFGLLNSGNETATSLVVVANYKGAITSNSEEAATSISPQQNLTFKFFFHNFSEPGSYAGSFTVGYTQDSSNFFAVFPCILQFENKTTSVVRFSDIHQSGNVLSANVINIGTMAVNATVSLILPPGFQYSPESANVSLGPSAQQAVYFVLSEPSLSGASYGAGAALSYMQGGMHYADAATFTIGGSQSGSSTLTKSPYLPYEVAVVVIVVILVLIAVSVLLRKRARPQRQTQPPSA